MIKTLMGSIREYKKPSILTPILVSIEVIVECVIPFYIAKLINHIQNGTDMSLILKYGLMLILLAFVSLFFGAMAGKTCATASCGFAKNCGTTCFTRFRAFRLPISINFQPQAL